MTTYRAYIRVSTEDQLLGPEAQRAAILAHLRGKLAADDIAFYQDQGVSGATPIGERPALSELLAELEPGDIVIAAKRDRYARSVYEMIALERHLASVGSRAITADGVSDEDTPEGRLMRTILDGFSEYERAMIALRTRKGLAVKKARGEYIGGQVARGYEVVGGKVQPTHEALAVYAEVRRLFLLLHSVRKVERELVLRRITLGGHTLGRTAIARIVTECQ